MRIGAPGRRSLPGQSVERIATDRTHHGGHDQRLPLRGTADTERDAPIRSGCARLPKACKDHPDSWRLSCSDRMFLQVEQLPLCGTKVTLAAVDGRAPKLVCERARRWPPGGRTRISLCRHHKLVCKLTERDSAHRVVRYSRICSASSTTVGSYSGASSICSRSFSPHCL
jgi:hypothetical protein